MKTKLKLFGTVVKQCMDCVFPIISKASKASKRRNKTTGNTNIT